MALQNLTTVAMTASALWPETERVDNDTVDDYVYYEDDVADHAEYGLMPQLLNSTVDDVTRAINGYVTPVLLAFAFAATLAMLTMTARQKLVQFHYISIYLTGLCTANLLKLLLISVTVSFARFHQQINHVSDVSCKLTVFLDQICREAQSLLIPLLVVDRCLATLGEFTSPAQRGCGWVQPATARFCNQLAAKISVVAAFVALILFNLWVLWAYGNNQWSGPNSGANPTCSELMPSSRWRMSFKFGFWFLGAIAIVAGNVLIVCAKAGKRAPSTGEPNANRSEESSTRQRAATVIVQAVSLAFLLANIPMVAVNIAYLRAHLPAMGTINVWFLLHAVSMLLSVVKVIVIAVVFFVVLRDVVLEEARYMLAALWNALNRVTSSELSNRINDLIGLMGSEEAPGLGDDDVTATRNICVSGYVE